MSASCDYSDSLNSYDMQLADSETSVKRVPRWLLLCCFSIDRCWTEFGLSDSALTSFLETAGCMCTLRSFGADCSWFFDVELLDKATR